MKDLRNVILRRRRRRRILSDGHEARSFAAKPLRMTALLGIVALMGACGGSAAPASSPQSSTPAPASSAAAKPATSAPASASAKPAGAATAAAKPSIAAPAASSAISPLTGDELYQAAKKEGEVVVNNQDPDREKPAVDAFS